MSRRETETVKVKAEGFDPLYAHLEYERGLPVKLRISSPGKYADQSLGVLLDAISEAITTALRPENERGG